jgi:hypothetical protein
MPLLRNGLGFLAAAVGAYGVAQLALGRHRDQEPEA